MPDEKPQVVLVMTVNKDIRENIRKVLEDRDLVVLSAENCEQALEALKHDAVDLFLADLRPPEAKGPDVLTEARQHLPDTPIVVIMETGQPEKAEEALNLGAWDCVFEPIARKALFLNTVEKALAQGRLIRENRRYRRRIREHTERNRVLLENVGSDIVYFDLDYRIVMASKQVLERSGLDEETIRSKSIFDLFPKHQAELFVKRIDQVVKDKGGGYFEDLVELPDGNRWLLASVQPVRDCNGEVIGIISIATDLTAQKEVEKALRESEEKYKLILDSAPNNIFYFSQDGRIQMLNTSATDFLGGVKESFIGKSIYEVFPDEVTPRVADRTMEVIRRVVESGAGEQREDWVNLQKGRRYISTSFHPVRDADGKILGVQTISTDLTDIKEAEEALRESEERYRLLFENAVTPISYVDLDGKILMLNIAGAENMGGKPSDFIGKNFMEYISPEQFAYFVKMLPRIIKSESGIKFDWQQRTPGRNRWFLSHCQPLRSASGNITAIQTVMSDITELKEAQEELRKHRDHLDKLVAERTVELERRNAELRQLRNLLSNIVDSMPSVLVGVDLEGRVIQWNREAHNETGVPEDQARGCTVTDVFPKLSKAMDKVRQAIRDRTPKKDSKVAWKTKGETRYSDVMVFPLLTNEVEGAVIRVDDVTEQVRMEQMMIQSEKMLTVGGLAAGMAHEINNPLAAIIQNTQVIKNRVSADLDKNRRVAEECGIKMEDMEAYLERRGIFSMIESVEEAGMRSAKIVKNMLSFSRRSERRFAPHDLKELVDSAVDLATKDYDLKKKYDFRDIKIVREYDPATPRVLCESSEIQQVLLNILRNGAEAMSESKDAEKPPRFILRIRPDNDMARIEIEDNGPGMDEETRRRVFEPFFTTKAVGVGTGLGLSVSYFIISENHGGTIAVDSDLDSGATFIIRLPVKKQD